MGHGTADFLDEAAVDEDFAGGDDRARFDIEEARGVKDEAVRTLPRRLLLSLLGTLARWLAEKGGDGRGDRENRQSKDCNFQFFHWRPLREAASCES